MTSEELQRLRGTNAPVFAWDGDEVFDCGLPRVYITSVAWGEETTASHTGRTYAGSYPPVQADYEVAYDVAGVDLAGDDDDDADGWLALRWGAEYYEEGMGVTGGEPWERAWRVDCFRAAELLYLWAASKGNPVAYLNLGYVYSYDRCEGRYWRDGTLAEGEPYPREERAVECFCAAADAGEPEACYKLGDLVRRGEGCEPSLTRAFELYQRAWDLGRMSDPAVWASAALRLGNACEYGEGCEQDFDRALGWYHHAEVGLGIAVEGGATWYKRARASAHDGALRCRQELDGRY